MKTKHLILLALLVTIEPTMAQNIDCKSVIKQPSHTWISHAAKTDGGSTKALMSAISEYEKCVDENIQQLHKKVYKKENAPMMGTSGNHSDFAKGIKNFSTLALKITATGGGTDNLKNAYVRLYEKQFRLLFYAGYLESDASPLATRIKSAKRPSLAEAKAYFEKSIAKFSASNQKSLSTSFDEVLELSTQTSIKKRYIYLYAIYTILPISDRSFSKEAF